MKYKVVASFLATLLLAATYWPLSADAAVQSDYNALPPFVASGAPPLVMLVMGKNHKLYYEAYNDASDLNDDGTLDIHYTPALIDYYGYFDNYKCYVYQSSSQLFEPTSVTPDKTNKTCSGNLEWSGDFLNYLTTSRIDALRKVLYGGYRSTDTTSTTILERNYVPQNAHSWGKEYASIATDGYDIRDYTPLSLPVAGTRHLFANVTLLGQTEPLLRVLNDSQYRIWEWVSIERPVAGSRCLNGGSGPYCATSSSTTTEIISSSFLSGVTQNVYSTPNTSVSWLTVSSYSDFDSLTSSFAYSSNLIASQSLTTIDGSRSGDYFLNIIDGTLTVPADGPYTFYVDGDDAVDFSIDTGKNGFASNDLVVGWYGAHSEAGSASSSHSATVTLNAGTYPVRFRHQEITGGASWHLYWDRTIPASAMTDLSVRVQVCKNSLLESNCKAYSDGSNVYYKPTGLLHKYGETNKMLFGLLTGSYANNTQGGVLRKPVSSFKDEVDSATGQFTSVNGIVNTIDSIRTTQFGGSYAYSCGWITTRPMNNGECADWGNPIAEMMYEGVRYFAGKGSPTSEFNISSSGNLDATLGLPLPAWNDPYATYPTCSQPFELVISDIYPTYDSDTLPGSYFGGSTPSDPISGMNVETLGNTIWNQIYGTTQKIFIGQSGTNYDNAPTAKEVDSFGTIRGLAPEEPTKQGSYYPASVAYYAKMNDLHSAADDQKMTTMAVALASPLPEIKIPVGNSVITLVPFAKSVGGSGISSSSTAFQPTDTIVDFYVESLTSTSGTFSINFEDVEQGADHDMDAIVKYSYVVNADGTVTVNLNSTYAAGGITQHMGYIISGTTSDGIYLEVKDVGGADIAYFLDTPPSGSTYLPLTASRTFTPSSNTTTSASFLKNPLWYAAQWGGFKDDNGNGVPDLQSEWDADGDNDPDNYFFVSNPLKLEQQLDSSFTKILEQASSGTAASVISNTRSGEGAIYQSVFYPSRNGGAYSLSWTGEVHALLVDSYGNMREDTNNNKQLDLIDDYIIEYVETSSGIKVNRYKDIDGNEELDSTETVVDQVSPGDLHYLWDSSDWLNSTALDSDISIQRSSYLNLDDKRYIFTWVDADNDLLVDSSEVLDFVWPASAPSASELDDVDKIYPYLNLYPSFADVPTAVASLSTTDFEDFIGGQTEREINYIRGKDYVDSAGNPYPLTVNGSDVAGTEMRPRFYNGGATWRLGDVTYSTPTVVGRPSENYQLLYGDFGYSEFVAKYKNRRQVVYVGANDGMLHAFNAGFYDSSNKKFCTAYPCTNSSASDPDLGAEMWAYVPYNLLPHLYWLTQTSYTEQNHVYYVDQKPRVFDAKIFNEEAACSTLSAPGCIHPDGYGTVMVVGMRLGGGSIVSDIDKFDRSTVVEAEDRTMKSAYMIFDITNPEAPPQLMAEITMPNMGFSTVYPTAFAMRDGNHDNTYASYNNSNPTSGENRWFLVLGSGPADASGNPGSVNSGTGVYDSTVLDDVKSLQPAKLYIIDLVKLGQQQALYSLNSSGVLSSGLNTYASYDSNSFLGDPVAVDFELDFNADNLYFGTVSGDVGAWQGKLRRVILDDKNDGDNDNNPANWTADNIAIDVAQPIISGPAVGLDDDGRHWVFFGTGRFYTSADKIDNDLRGFYGLKEPLNSSNLKDWSTVTISDLLDTTNTKIYTNKIVVASNISSTAAADGNSDKTWEDLLAEQASKDGWYLDFSAGERNLGQATLYGGLLGFTSYTPTADVCDAGGESSLWALYYKTGTAYYSGVLGVDSTDTATSGTGAGGELAVSNTSLGDGMTTSPSIQTGRSDGSNVYIQSSTGKISKVNQDNPLATKSGLRSWRLVD